MQSVTSATAVATTARANNITLFASLELSKSNWVVTINSPGSEQRDHQRFGECLSSTLLVATSPAARANLQRRRNPLNWKLLKPSHLPTVPRPGSFPAARTRSTPLSLR